MSNFLNQDDVDASDCELVNARDNFHVVTMILVNKIKVNGGKNS